MAEFLAFGGEVPLVELMHRWLDRHLVDHLEVEATVDEGICLLRIVGEEADPPQAQILEQLDPDAIVAGVGLVAEGQVRLDRVEPLILQLVGLDLLDEPDAAALLRKIDEYAAALPADPFEGHVQLVAAVAPQAVEQVAGEAR